jgi:hypothetical protein
MPLFGECRQLRALVIFQCVRGFRYSRVVETVSVTRFAIADVDRIPLDCLKSVTLCLETVC